jgi:chemotaxis protein CheX
MTATTVGTSTGFPLALRDATERGVERSFPFLNSLALDPTQTSIVDGPCDGIFAVIGFLGDFNWSFTFICPRETCPGIAKSFAGFDIPYREPDMADVIGEMANVLAGEISSELYAKKVQARMSLPTVARGSDVEFVSPEGSFQHLLVYRSELGSFGFRLVLGRHTNSWAKRIGFEK